MAEKYNFQYCQKIVLFDEDERVLLARRKGETDYDETYSFIGGKLETTDNNQIEGILREKREEIGRRALILVAPHISFNVHYRKHDGTAMILPHIYGLYVSGKIELNDEYSDFKWIETNGIDEFEPKIETIPDAVRWARAIKKIVSKNDLIEIQ